MIVPLVLSHIDEIEAIERESFTDPWSKNAFMDLLYNPFAVCFTAIDAADSLQENKTEEVVGYVIMYHVASEGQILNIAVKNTHRNQKIATQIFAAVIEYAQNANIESLTLEVRASNIPALGLYKKLGFEEVGIRKNYYSNPLENAILMTLIL